MEYEPNAVVYEPSAITARDQIKQRKRTGIGTILCIVKHLSYFIPPHDIYSLFIFPSHKILPLFSPFILLAIPILYILIWNVKIIILHIVFMFAVFLCVFFLLIFFNSKLIKDTPVFSLSVSSIYNISYYVLLNEYLIILACKDFFLKKYTVLWEKAKSTRV